MAGSVSQSNRGGLLARLSAILGRSRDLTPLAEPVRKILWDDNRARALRGVDFEGKPLVPLAQRTIEDRARHGFGPGPPLVRRGEESHLISGCVISVYPSDGTLSFTKSWPGAPWMQFHALGAARLPRRDVMGWGKEEIEAVRKMLPRHILGR